MSKFMGEDFAGVLCVFPGVIVSEDSHQDFIDFLRKVSENNDLEIQPLGNLITNNATAKMQDGSQRSDFYFALDGDISGIIIPRLTLGFKWYEDFVLNYPCTTYLIDNSTVPIKQLVTDYIIEN